MKPIHILKFLVYTTIVILLCVASAMIFRNHPEVQLAFLIPGVFVLVYSKIRDEVYVSEAVRLRMARAK